MRRRSNKTVTVYFVLYDGSDRDGSGPAGDGTFTFRSSSRATAEGWARGRTCYGRPAKVDTMPDVPVHIAQRWGVA